MERQAAISIPYFGETLAVLTAMVWGIAVIFFKKSGETAHPLALNLFKCLLAVVLILLTMPFFGETLFREASRNDFLILLLSGVLGIGLADTMFFKSLNTLGAGMSAIVDCLYSPSVIAMSMIWLGDRLSFMQYVGVATIISAVLVAATRKGRAHLTPKELFWGVFWGAMAMITMAVGIVIAKPILVRSPLLWVTEVRLWGGIAVLAPMILFHPGRRGIIASLRFSSDWKYFILGSFAGSYVSLVLWLAGMKYAQTSVAAALNQTSNIFIFIFAAMFLHEPINQRRLIAIAMGIAGTLLVTFT